MYSNVSVWIVDQQCGSYCYLLRIAEILRYMFLNHRLSACSHKSPAVNIAFNRSLLSQWCDVTLLTSDNMKVKAHKCVLTARMEYFRTMLTGHWFEVGRSEGCLCQSVTQCKEV